MKHILIAFLIALGLGLIFTSKSQVGEPYIKLNDKEPLLFDSITSIFVKEKVEEISGKHQFVPLFFVFDGKLFFIKSKIDRIDDSLFVGNKFGIINQNCEVILEQKYDKIYNPNFTITNCLEIAQNGKVGLINLKTNKIIEPQFEYIVPSGNTPSHIAYGLKGNDWYELNSETMQQTQAPNYSPENFLSEISEDIFQNINYFVWSQIFLTTTKINKYENNKQYVRIILNNRHSNWKENKIDLLKKIIYSDNKLSSYLEHLKNNDDKVFNKLKFSKYYTTTKYLNNDTYYKNIYSKFIISFFEDAAEDRVEYIESIYFCKLKDNLINSKLFYNQYSGQYNLDTKFYNDSLIYSFKIINTQYDYYQYYTKSDLIYKINYFEYPIYNFYKISEDLEIDSLKSNRYYNFTEYVKLDDSFLKNDYYEFLKTEFRIKNNDTINYPDEDSLDVNSIIYHHLRINDLELMKNEILADNGCKIKDKKWFKFFKRFAWYKPLYEFKDVKLNEIDKFNLDFIDKRIKEMKGREKDFTKPEYYLFVAAG